MHLVNNIHPVLRFGRVKVGFFPQITNVVNTVVGGGINLGNVKRRAGINALAHIALITRLTLMHMRAIDRFCKYTRASGFARSPRPDK